MFDLVMVFASVFPYAVASPSAILTPRTRTRGSQIRDDAKVVHATSVSHRRRMRAKQTSKRLWSQANLHQNSIKTTMDGEFPEHGKKQVAWIIQKTTEGCRQVFEQKPVGVWEEKKLLQQKILLQDKLVESLRETLSKLETKMNDQSRSWGDAVGSHVQIGSMFSVSPTRFKT